MHSARAGRVRDAVLREEGSVANLAAGRLQIAFQGYLYFGGREYGNFIDGWHSLCPLSSILRSHFLNYKSNQRNKPWKLKLKSSPRIAIAWMPT